jgi:hypothetical protein
MDTTRDDHININIKQISQLARLTCDALSLLFPIPTARNSLTTTAHQLSNMPQIIRIGYSLAPTDSQVSSKCPAETSLRGECWRLS